jgi:DNA-directed RNA polymerase subunit RPC12/RpoP
MYDEAARDRYLRRTYNLTLDEYKRILASQGGRCFICEKVLEGVSHPVDHDHVSGLVRGVLCSYCNHRVVGKLRDYRVAEKIAAYLRNPPANRVIGERLVPKKAPKRRRATTPSPRRRNVAVTP